MDFHYGTSFGKASPEAYERLLLDAMSGDATLFARRDRREAWALDPLKRRGTRRGCLVYFIPLDRRTPADGLARDGRLEKADACAKHTR
jgi:hypothetical protein